MKERRFNPSRRAVSDAAKALVAAVLAQVDTAETRQRRRSTKAEALHREAVEAIACDLAHGYLHDPELRIMVELSKQHLSPDNRRAPFMTEAFAPLVRLMAKPEVGLVSLEIGEWTPFGGIRSTVAAGQRLRALVDQLHLDYSDFAMPRPEGPPVVLRGCKVARVVGGKVRKVAEDLPLPPTEETARLIAEMDRVNGYIADADLAWAGPGRIDLHARRLRRIFNNGTFAEGGRLFDGFWQALRSDDRLAHLRIDGQRIAQVDFCQFGLRMAYAEVGVEPPPGDLYALPGYSAYRTEVKKIIQALLSADRPLARMPAGGRGRLPARVSFAAIRDAIAAAHPAVVPVFGSRAALRHMRAESDIAVGVVLRLAGEGITTLPVHDALLVPIAQVERAKTVIQETCRAIVGLAIPVEVEQLHTVEQEESPARGSLGNEQLIPLDLPLSGGHKP